LSAVLTMFLTLPADAPASEPAGNLAMAEGA
jgi:hypothetical protein